MKASYIPIGLHSEMILLKCIYILPSNNLTYVYFKSITAGTKGIF